MQHYFPLMLFTIFAHNAPEGFKEEIACKMGGLYYTWKHLLLLTDLITVSFVTLVGVRRGGEVETCVLS